MPRIDLPKFLMDLNKVLVVLASWENTFSLAFSKKPPFIACCLAWKGIGIYSYKNIWKLRPWVVSILPKVSRGLAYWFYNQAFPNIPPEHIPGDLIDTFEKWRKIRSMISCSLLLGSCAQVHTAHLLTTIHPLLQQGCAFQRGLCPVRNPSCSSQP